MLKTYHCGEVGERNLRKRNEERQGRLREERHCNRKDGRRRNARDR